jgi:DNA-directed RNA polymerase subunit M/transcription elongation factor TFIIS
MSMPLTTFATRRRARKTQPSARPETPRAHCPTCGEAEGFLMVVDGAAYRVLEDKADTEILSEGGDPSEVFVTCNACKTTMDAASILAHVTESTRASMARPATEIRMGPRRNRIHPTGGATTRQTADGRTLPQCPECGAAHDFFVDLDGAAYRVLEDDDDTDLLSEATNLLCSRCHAVFEV